MSSIRALLLIKHKPCSAVFIRFLFFSGHRLNLRPEKSLLSLGLHKAKGSFLLTDSPLILVPFHHLLSEVLLSLQLPWLREAILTIFSKYVVILVLQAPYSLHATTQGCPNRRLRRRKVVSISFVLSPHFGSHELLRE